MKLLFEERWWDHCSPQFLLVNERVPIGALKLLRRKLVAEVGKESVAPLHYRVLSGEICNADARNSGVAVDRSFTKSIFSAEVIDSVASVIFLGT